MEIHTRQYDGASLVSFQGNLDAISAGRAKASLQSALDQGQKNLILDLSEVAFMSSSGIRLIVEFLKGSRQRGGDLRLAGAQPGVWRTLEISGLGRVLKAYDSIEGAISSFDPRSANDDEPRA
jgi:anti-sigma B factor antagonist